MRRRLRLAVLPWGVAAAGLYVAVAAASFAAEILPVRPLYDGLAPFPPYHWVNPPPDFARGNRSAQPGRGTLALTPTASGTVVTDDGQVILSFALNTVAPRAGETRARVTITPLDPARLAPPPADLAFDSNAYRIEIVYDNSGIPAILRRPVTVILRYATGATELLSLSDGRWVPLQATRFPTALQIYADVQKSVGVFVAVRPPRREPPLWVYLAGYTGVLLFVVGLIVLFLWVSPTAGPPKRDDE